MNQPKSSVGIKKNVLNKKFNANKKRLSLPPIGLRLIKTSVAVFICFLIYILRGERGNLYYSLITAIFCMQPYLDNSKNNAKQRIFGTINGAIWGYLILSFNTYILTDVSIIWNYLIISIACILVIYTSVLLKKPTVAYFSSVVYFSVAVVHVTDPKPYIFVMNRMIDTLIGIGVSLVVNQARLPRRFHNDILFVSGIDETLVNEKGQLSSYSIVEINRMLNEGALFTVATERTTASLIDTIKDLNLRLPIIAFNGAILLDVRKKEYISKKIIDINVVYEIKSIMREEQLCLFTTALLQDTLIIYYDEFYSEVEEKLYEKYRSSQYRNYMKGNISKDAECFYLMCIGSQEIITKVFQRMKHLPIYDNIRMVRVLTQDVKGYTQLRIYHKDATKSNMIDELKNMIGVEKSITFGTIPGEYDVLVNDKDKYNGVAKKMKKIYEPIKFGSGKSYK